MGNGTENNTLALLAAGWSGFWVGGEELAFDYNPGRIAEPNFSFLKQWVSLSNIVELYRTGLAVIRQRECNVVSLDLDGNDFYLAEKLLSAGALPAVFIVEYNAKFRPPIHFKIAYDENHRWMGDDYFGASLCEFYELFSRHGYFLVCCNTIGVNAFFVREEFRESFRDVPLAVEELYESPKYYLYGLETSGHKTSMRTIEGICRRLNGGEKR